MIVALAVALQLAAASATTSGPLVVKDATRSVSIPLVAGESGPLLRAELMRPVVAITVSHLMGDRWMLIVNGAAIEVEPGVRFATVGDERYQLAAAPELRKGALYVPLQLVVEVIPRVAGNLTWDAERFELRAFSTVSRHADQEPDVTPAPTVAHSSLRARRLVVVDAGHGGPDTGMHGPIGGGPQIFEKNVTLTVAKRVGAELNARGIAVKYTRTTDTLIALSDRGRIANDAHADLFVSIHVNAANPGWKDPGAARGFETYFLAEAKTEDARRVEQMENEVVKFEAKSSAQAGDPLNFVLNDMAQNEHLRESNELAELIQRRLGRVHPAPNRGVKQAGFRVLVTAFMPAVLVEIGFGTNPADAAFITDPAHVDEISAAISDAVVEYLKRYERRVSTTAGAAATSGGSGQR
ncbi:MAG TPA: N-acetylmuramoyl-L-alanine amidase [Gemmatimonadaceae bacterium]